jgi:hypothetical protein
MLNTTTVALKRKKGGMWRSDFELANILRVPSILEISRANVVK